MILYNISEIQPNRRGKIRNTWDYLGHENLSNSKWLFLLDNSITSFYKKAAAWKLARQDDIDGYLTVFNMIYLKSADKSYVSNGTHPSILLLMIIK